ncbi:MAG: tyrosine--tRNA ligase [Planctomycetota bacterium]|nr:tyrosine--tRNA ligase [Planctomycetota bacterium]
MPVSEVSKQLELIKRGAVQIVTEDDLARRIAEAAKEGRPLRVKLGMDPTAPDCHLGHSVVLRKMREFQDLGHQAVLVVGDYTARVGDPSGQNETRPQLSAEEIEKNATTYLEQVGRVLDLSKLEIVRNGDWFRDLSFDEVLRLTSQMTVARMLERDDFAIRYKSGTAIQIHEFIYCLMQGYDSVQVRSDVELGGTDQTFNLLVGRDLQRAHGQPAQICITMPLLEGLAGGPKMSKSLSNAVGLTDEPDDMYGKVMSIPDRLMRSYFTLLTRLPEGRIEELLSDQTHPRDAKGELARQVTGDYHGAEAADRAAEEFIRRFRRKEDPSEMPEIRIPSKELKFSDEDAGQGTIGIARIIVLAGFAPSNNEARRLVKQGAVELDRKKVSDPMGSVLVRKGAVLKVGKRRIGKIVW